MQSLFEMLREREQAANLSTYTPEPLRCFISISYNDDDDEKTIIPLNEIISQILSSIAITPVLPIMEPEDSLIVRDEDLCTIPEKESDEFIKSSVEDLVPILRESDDTSNSDKECDFPFCDKFVTFSNPLFDANDDFTSSNDELLPEEDVLEDINRENSLLAIDEPFLLDIPPPGSKLGSLEEVENFDPFLSLIRSRMMTRVADISYLELNEYECFEPGGGEIDADIPSDFEDDYYNSEGDIIYLESLLIDDTIRNLPPEVFLDHDPRKDKPDNDDLKSMDKVFDLRIHEKIISLTYVRLPFEDRHYFSLAFVIRIYLFYLTYSMDSSTLLSSRSEDTIFDPDISVFSFYSLEPVVSHWSGTFMCFNIYLNILNESPMEICFSTCFVPNIMMIWGDSS
uniref:Reverse transcriptase domain-containing protein n=1 Tax=Tanacetum cinerariifolium TaxID=118510 RepID=A0A699JUF5_TANCI|nr:hypothetical protein [Tanacetum cinerariifolium]